MSGMWNTTDIPLSQIHIHIPHGFFPTAQRVDFHHISMLNFGKGNFHHQSKHFYQSYHFLKATA